jgi:hypothetical protein
VLADDDLQVRETWIDGRSSAELAGVAPGAAVP